MAEYVAAENIYKRRQATRSHNFLIFDVDK